MRSLPARRLSLGSGLLLALALIALAVTGLGAGGLHAASAPGWRVGEAAQVALPLSVSQQRTLATAELRLARELGLPGLAATTTRARDRTLDLTVDTTELAGLDGRLATVLTRDATSGRLRSAVRLAWTPDLDLPRLDAVGAIGAARRFLAAAGWAPPSRAAESSWDDGMGAWQVRWPRLVAGVAAPTDGLVAWIHRGGQLKALAINESPLAPAPAATITPEAAQASVRAYLQRTGIARMTGLSVLAPVLRWAEANDFIDPSLPDAPAPALRLAWVVHLSYLPPGWSERHEVELAVDAGTGELIGGSESA
jgi:hypothetical protein